MEFHQNSTVIPDVYLWNATGIPLEYCFKIPAFFLERHLEIAEVVLVHCYIVNNDYQQDSRVLYTFVPNKPFGRLLEISPTNQILLKIFSLEYDEIKVWFTDQNSQPLEIEEE